jgi:hypothetical protein
MSENGGVMATEEEMMSHLPDVVKFCELSKTKYRVANFRSLKVVQVFSEGIWITFDPINRSKDTLRMMMLMSKIDKIEVFRKWLLQEALDELERNSAVQEKR